MRIPYRGAGTVFLKREAGKYKVFLGQRSDRPFFDFLAVPGGGFDKDKDRNDLDCAFRECLEETSIDCIKLIKDNKAVILGDRAIKAPLFSWRSFFILVKDCSDFENAKVDLKEFSEIKWYDVKNLNPLKLRPFTTIEIKRALRLSDLA